MGHPYFRKSPYGYVKSPFQKRETLLVVSSVGSVCFMQLTAAEMKTKLEVAPAQSVSGHSMTTQ